jgi:hypothetical protein
VFRLDSNLRKHLLLTCASKSLIAFGMTNLKDLSAQQLQQIIDIKQQIEDLQSELDSIAGGGGTGKRLGRPPGRPKGTGQGPGRPRKKHKMSAAGRRAIALAAKKRWAAYRGKAKPAKTGKKRKMSAAARKKMAEVAKARWAKAKAAGKMRL